MPRRYVKIVHLSEEIFKLKAEGLTNKQIASRFNLSEKQIKNLINRENRKQEKLKKGELPKSKGRPKKIADEVAELKMEVELLRNFLLEVGRQ